MTTQIDAAALIRNARHPALAAYVNAHAIMRGSFTLASGRKSNYYCDGKQVSFSGEGLALIARAIDDETRDLHVDAIGGMDMGATPIVAAYAVWSSQHGKPISSFVVRKDVKGHGTKKDIEGVLPSSPSRVVVVDDVITTGGSTLKAIDVIRSKGHDVVLAISVLDRNSGGLDALTAIGVKYQPLVTIAELGIVNESSAASEVAKSR